MIDAALVAHDARRPGLGQPRRDHAAGEPCDARQEILRRVERHDAAGLQHRDAAAQHLGFLEVVRREDDRVAVAVQLADELPEALAQLDVHARGGLVEHDDRRLVDERLADQHAALHAAGERSHVGIRLRREVEVMQDLVDPRALLAQAEVTRLELERLAHAEERIEHELLRDDAEASPCGSEIGDDVVAEHAHGAAVGARQSRDDRDERRLAGAVWTEQPEELALRDRQVDAVERPHLPEAARHIPDFDRGVHARERAGPSQARTAPPRGAASEASWGCIARRAVPSANCAPSGGSEASRCIASVGAHQSQATRNSSMP